MEITRCHLTHTIKQKCIRHTISIKKFFKKEAEEGIALVTNKLCKFLSKTIQRRHLYKYKHTCMKCLYRHNLNEYFHAFGPDMSAPHT